MEANCYRAMRRAQRKINIFDNPQKRRIATSIMTHPEEVQLLRDRIMALEHALKLSNIKAEGYEVMMDILKDEYGIDLSKKSRGRAVKDLKGATRNPPPIQSLPPYPPSQP